MPVSVNPKARNEKNRTAIYKTLLILEHHAKPLKDVVSYITALALAGGFTPRSTRGGPNSWELRHPDGRTFLLRARTNYTIEVMYAGRVKATLATRNDVVKWFQTL